LASLLSVPSYLRSFFSDRESSICHSLQIARSPATIIATSKWSRNAWDVFGESYVNALGAVLTLELLEDFRGESHLPQRLLHVFREHLLKSFATQAHQERCAPVERSCQNQCRYSPLKGHCDLVFIVYVGASPSEAKQAFERLCMWFRSSRSPRSEMRHMSIAKAIYTCSKTRCVASSQCVLQMKQLLELAGSVIGRM
jgi:hypothetical protein